MKDTMIMKVMMIQSRDVRSTFWLSPLNVEIQAANIFASLIELDPSNSGLYELNYMNFLAKLHELDKEIASLFLKWI